MPLTPEEEQLKYDKKVKQLVGIGFAHVIPCVLIVTDLSMSSIPFYPRHFIIFAFFGLLYIGYLLLQSYIVRGADKPPVYPSHDWHNYPLRSSLFTVAAFAIYTVAFFVLVWVSDRKLRRHYHGANRVVV